MNHNEIWATSFSYPKTISCGKFQCVEIYSSICLLFFNHAVYYTTITKCFKKKKYASIIQHVFLVCSQNFESLIDFRRSVHDENFSSQSYKGFRNTQSNHLFLSFIIVF